MSFCIVVIGLSIATIIHTSSKQLPAPVIIPELRTVTERDNYLGSTDAPIHVIVYFDAQCPACNLFHTKTLRQLRGEYTNSIVVAYRHLPLDHIHAYADLYARTLVCASDISDEIFWEYLGALFEVQNNQQEGEAAIINAAKMSSINSDELLLCARSEAAYKRVSDDRVYAALNGVTSTPTLIVSVGDVTKNIPSNSFTKIKNTIDQMIATYNEHK